MQRGHGPVTTNHYDPGSVLCSADRETEREGGVVMAEEAKINNKGISCFFLPLNLLVEIIFSFCLRLQEKMHPLIFLRGYLLKLYPCSHLDVNIIVITNDYCCYYYN